MAFINCGECGRRIVDKRKVCPKCGTNFKELEKEKRLKIEYAKYKEIERARLMKKDWISCPNCHYEGVAQKNTPGHFLIEVLLWVFTFWAFFIPGLIYSIWRLTNRGLKCPACEWTHVVKINPI